MTNKEKYTGLCVQEPTICVYDQPWWMDAVCGEENWDVLLYEKGDTILGALPYYIKKRFGLKYITQPPFTQHNGVWIRYPAEQTEAKRLSFEKEVMYALIDQLQSFDICFYRQCFAPAISNWQPFYWREYKQTTAYTYRIDDISIPDALFNTFQPNKRKNIRKASQCDYQIKFDLPAERFYLHHKECLEKQRRDIGYSLELFTRIYNAAYQNHAGRSIYLEDTNGKLLCALFNTWDAQWGYDLISAFDPECRNSGAPDLLFFSMLQYLSGKVQGYDFEGSMIEGVEESFRHFGATQTPYFRIHKTYTHNPLLKLAIELKLQSL